MSARPARAPLSLYTRAQVGVRILECERSLGGPATAIELWDTGGSTDYESCWPAIMKDTTGVILVYNPENEGHVSESGAWRTPASQRPPAAARLRAARSF